jgi:hypothetical protein
MWKMEFFDGQSVELRAPPIRLAEMQGVIRKTAENAMAKSKMEAGLAMHTSIIETLPWIDCGEVFDQIEARGRAAGEAAGRAKTDAPARSPRFSAAAS